jgi:hypothetical protein
MNSFFSEKKMPALGSNLSSNKPSQKGFLRPCTGSIERREAPMKTEFSCLDVNRLSS